MSTEKTSTITVQVGGETIACDSLREGIALFSTRRAQGYPCALYVGDLCADCANGLRVAIDHPTAEMCEDAAYA